MKTIKNIFRNSIIIILFIIPFSLFSQGDPPPPPPGHTETGNTNGEAPIGSGLFILIGLGAVYGGKKINDLKKKKLDE